LYERPANRFVADFIGINNLVEGKVLAVDDGAQGQLRAGTALGEIAAIHGGPLKPGDRCVICVRPENIALEGQPGGGVNRLNGKISFAAYLGNTLRYDVDLGQGITFKTDIRDPWHHEPLAMGAAVTLSCPVSSTLAIPAD
jgi:ABC-type Fe3+/spermidine/putrescine transport system ATPase subunit